MDFQGATQAYLWALPIVAMANYQYYHEQIFGFHPAEQPLKPYWETDC